MNQTTAPSHDPLRRLQLFLVLDGLVRLFVWSSPMAFTAAIFTYCDAWPREHIINADLAAAWLWTRKLTHLVLLYNLLYVVHLIVIRLLIARPREGRHETAPGTRINWHLLRAALLGTLTKARYEPPFPAFLVFHMANMPMLRQVMSAIFGPKSKSCYVSDPTVLDPWGVTIGRNVVIGFGTTLAGHYQEQAAVVFQQTIIEDDVLIGGHCAVSGAHIKRGAVVGAGSIVLPGSVIGPGEYWSGNPARRRSKHLGA